MASDLRAAADAVVARRLNKLQKKVQSRRTWLESILLERAVIAPHVLQWNPQAEFGGGIYLDDIDLVVIELTRSSPDLGVVQTPTVAAPSAPRSILIDSIAHASMTVPDISVYGWALFKSENKLVPVGDMPCVPIGSCHYTTPRGAARLVCNALAQFSQDGTIPAHVAIYAPKMKRLSAYKVNPKFVHSHNLANETNLSSASKKISHISLADASYTSLNLAT